MTKLSIVGVGPGSPDFITPAAKKAVLEAQLIVGAKRSLDLFQSELKGEVIQLTGQNVDASLINAVNSVKAGRTVVLLSTGDPGFSGLLGSVLSRISAGEVELEVVPGISSIQACAAALCIAWDNADILTFHNGASVEKKHFLLSSVKTGKTIFLLPEPKSFTPSQIAKFLIENGINRLTQVAICENITLGNENIVETSLEEIVELTTASLCVMVIRSNLQK